MSGVNQYTKLMLHMNGANGSTVFTDVSNSAHIFTAHGDAKISTAQSVFGGTSGEFDGLGDYIESPDSADWDFFASSIDNKTIDFRVRFSNVTIDQMVVAQSQDDSANFWWIIHEATLGIRVVVFVGGVRIISDLIDPDILSPHIWYHYAIIKVGSSYGIYRDGIQKGYVSGTGTGTLAGPLRIGSDNGARFFLSGWADELRFQHNNDFAANPNALLTDTITVPSSEYVATSSSSSSSSSCRSSSSSSCSSSSSSCRSSSSSSSSSCKSSSSSSSSSCRSSSSSSSSSCRSSSSSCSSSSCNSSSCSSSCSSCSSCSSSSSCRSSSSSCSSSSCRSSSSSSSSSTFVVGLKPEEQTAFSLDSILNFYINLLIIQYKLKVKARATVKLLANQNVCDGIMQEEQECFYLDKAVGAQLTALGKIVGVPRQVYGLDLDHTFFSFTRYTGTPNSIGFGRYTDVPYIYDITRYLTNATHTLNDFELRFLIKLKIISNNAYTSFKGLKEALYNTYFGGVDILAPEKANIDATSQYFNFTRYDGIPDSVGFGRYTDSPYTNYFYRFSNFELMTLTYQVYSAYQKAFEAAIFLDIVPRPMGVKLVTTYN